VFLLSVVGFCHEGFSRLLQHLHVRISVSDSVDKWSHLLPSMVSHVLAGVVASSYCYVRSTCDSSLLPSHRLSFLGSCHGCKCFVLCLCCFLWLITFCSALFRVTVLSLKCGVSVILPTHPRLFSLSVCNPLVASLSVTPVLLPRAVSCLGQVVPGSLSHKGLCWVVNCMQWVYGLCQVRHLACLRLMQSCFWL
jgi:hypothetical protein